MKRSFLALSLMFALVSNVKAENTSVAHEGHTHLTDGIYAKFQTTRGEIILKLEHEKTPMTVANFVGLAEGNFEALGKKFTTPYYDGLKFHRVIANFMIQGGDPTGTGSSGPGYNFYDEIDETLRHDKAGTFSMANSGPTTNGSQFFITHGPTPHLDGKHTVFGYVVEGQSVVDAIQQDDIMTKVTIERIGNDAKKWNATKVFAEAYDKVKATEDDKKAVFAKIAAMSKDEYSVYMLSEVKKKYPNAQQTESGLVYIIENKGEGVRPVSGTNLSVHYTGKFMDGTKFDSSVDRGQPMDFQYKVQSMIPGFEEGLAMLGKGGKGIFIIPYFDAYGPQGRPGAIPPYSDLVFELEIVDMK